LKEEADSILRATFKTVKEKESYFNKKFFPYLSALYNYAFYLTKEEEDANDLVQDTFVKAFRFIENFQEGTNEKAWLFKIMKNGFINDYRKKTNKPVHFSFDTIIESNDNDTSEEYTPQGVLADHEVNDPTDQFRGLMGDEITKALDHLQADYRQIIVLADVEEFSYEELSDILDIPIGTVRSRLFRARNLLKNQLQNYGKKMGYKDKRN
jgi:RNA polymerase sigma factor (sigma-70 family)